MTNPKRVIELSDQISTVAESKILEIGKITSQVRILALNALIEAQRRTEECPGEHLVVVAPPDGRPAAVFDLVEMRRLVPVAESRSSALRDLAGLLRSVDHAAHWACLSRGEEAGPVAAVWIASARAAIRVAYEARLAELGAPLRVDPRLLAAFEAEKAAYEFVYAARFLPAWLEVPRRALPSVLAA